MSLNPFNTTVNHNWNYSNDQREGYSPELIGTVLSLQEVQSTVYNPNPQAPRVPAFWPDGNPKFNIRMALADQQGQLKLFTFAPAGKAAKQGLKPSIHMMLWDLVGRTTMENLIGKTIKIATQPGTYGTGNPRPWACELVEAGPFALATGELPEEYKVPRVLCDTAVSGGQMQRPMQQAQPMQYQQQPMMQQAQPMYQQPAQAQPMQYQQPMQQAQPQVDPSVMAAMQQMGATNIQMQPAPQPVPSIYDENLPF